AWGQCELQKLLGSDCGIWADFGSAIAVYEDVAVIAARGWYGDTGAAYVFRSDGAVWSEEAKLTASDSAFDDRFGTSVAVEGDVVIVGAIRDSYGSEGVCSAYVFRYDGQNWAEEAILIGSDTIEGDAFGMSVAISGEVIAVGATDNDGHRGAVYVFRRSGDVWIEEAKLVASDAEGWEEFGRTVAMDDDVVIVGAPDDRYGKGSVYVFRRVGSEWVEEAKIYHELTYVKRFGRGLALDGEYALVGAPCDHYLGSGSGMAFIYHYDGSEWTLVHELVRADPGSHDEFGLAVALKGDTAAVGAPTLIDTESTAPGYACVFTYDGSAWVQEARLLSSDLAKKDNLGCAVALAGDQVLVGALGDDDQGLSSGSAYVFPAALDGEDCNENLIADSCDIAVGLSTDCQYNGIPDECDIDFGTSEDVNNDGVPDECVAFCEPCEPVQVLASDGSDYDYFGKSVGISGHAAIVGAPGDDDLGNYSGSAYIFRLEDSQWLEEAKLLASNGASGDEFGRSAGISGDLVVVGSPYRDGESADSGSAYVFRYDGSAWSEEAVLTASDGAEGHYFGWSAAICGDLIVVGAPYYFQWHDIVTGCAYVFRYTEDPASGRGSWVEEARLLASDGADGDFFGGAVAIDQNTIVVGAEDAAGGGKAYVFRHDGSAWVEEAILLPPEDIPSSDFGRAVDISADALIVGDRFGGLYYGGVAHIYRFNGSSWVVEASFSLDYPEASFGGSVGISGDTAVAGAYDASNRIRIYRFDGQGWNDVAQDYLDARAAAIDGDAALVGSTDGGPGAAYFFSGMIGVDCNLNGVADGCDIFSGASEDANDNGIPDECEECPEDLNGDDVVDIDDLFEVLNHWGQGVGKYDVNNDGVVDIDDIFAVLAAWGPCE
ncbi:MAG: hypothetical protein JSV91_14630, partial [Phycisphaerales bacterium]